MSTGTILASFNRWRDGLLKALKPEDATEDELLNDLFCGRAQLWEGERCAVVTQCVAPDRFHVWLAAGDLRDVVSMLNGAIAWARTMGLKRMTVDGRQGWRRVLRWHGFDGDDLLERAI